MDIVLDMICCVLSKQWAEYFLFASLLVAVCVIFSIMAYFYTYIDPAEIEAQFKNKDEKDEPKYEEVQMEKKKDSVEHQEEDRSKQTKM